MVATKGETFHAYWEKFMKLLDAHLNHDHNTRLLLNHFYGGMTFGMKSMASSLSGGKLFSKNLEEALEFLASMAIMTRQYDGFLIKGKNIA